jgi:hypothetical protein
VVSFILSQWDRCSGGFTIVLKHRNLLARRSPFLYISQLTLYSTDCASYQDFLDRELTRKRLNHRFLLAKLKSSPRSSTVATMTWLTVMECFTDNHGYILFVLVTILSVHLSWHYRIYNKNNTMDTTSGAGTAFPLAPHKLNPSFYWGSCCSICSVYCFINNCFCFVLCLLVVNLIKEYTFPPVDVYLKICFSLHMQ